MKSSFIKAIRAALGLTMQDMAEALHISSATLCRVESGNRDLTEGELSELSKLTGLTVAEIVEFRDNERRARELSSGKQTARLRQGMARRAARLNLLLNVVTDPKAKRDIWEKNKALLKARR